MEMPVMTLSLRSVLNTLALVALVSVVSVPAFAATNPVAYRFYEQGIAAFNQGQTPAAVQAFEQAVQQDPNFGDAWFNLASVQFRAGQQEKARAAFEQVLRLNPDDTQARYNLALCLEKLNRSGDAYKALQAIPAGSPKYADAQQKMAALAQKWKGAGSGTVANNPANNPVATQPVNTPAANPVVVAGGARSPRKFAASLSGPTGMALGPRGEVYVANYSQSSIVRIDPDGKQSVLVKNAGLSGPIGLVRDPRSGDLYVANYLNGKVLRVNPQGQTTLLSEGLKQPYSLLLDTLANVLYVSEQGSNSVSQIKL
jgi:cytochrome c-type biogenesis protein CcmH/NrfG